MLQFLLDTDHVTLLEHRHPPVMKQLASRAIGDVGVSAVTVEEALRGRLAALASAKDGTRRIQRYAYLIEAVKFFSQLTLVPFDQVCEIRFQGLLSSRVRVGTRDLKIAAVALANNVVLVTRNRRDFGRIPGLVLVDWSV